MENINFFDLKLQYADIEQEINESISNVFKDSSFASGPYVEKFEKDFSTYCNVNHCVGLNSGTSALHLALLANGIKANDEVITVSHTFISTVWAISYCNAKPVFVDINDDDKLINVSLLEKAITKKTKAVIPVHLYGNPADMKTINDIAKKYNLKVIEDAAQAHSATYNNKIIGDSANTVCFSFYPGKNLGAYGEGGAVVTNDSSVAEQIKIMRDHGQYKKYYHDILGFNYRMDGLQGAILSVKLKYLKKWTALRNHFAAIYNNKIDSQFEKVKIQKNSTSAYHLYVIHCEQRDNLKLYLMENGIGTGIHYPIPVHMQKVYKHLGYKKGDFPITEKTATTCLSLPLYPEIKEENVLKIIKSINNF
jgi:dTDP-4-amino-4,6-dideoxygalactose transaminase